MNTRKKLSEAEFFLEKLGNADFVEFSYYLSAFLSAWRSVLDIMLYDFTAHYALGLTPDDKITDQIFKGIATALKNKEALEFLKWWQQKQGILKNNPLWSKRILIVHRGYPKIEVSTPFYVLGSGLNSSTITVSSIPTVENYAHSYGVSSIPLSAQVYSEDEPGDYEYFSDVPNKSVLEICKQAMNEMTKIVKETEEQFSVQL